MYEALGLLLVCSFMGFFYNRLSVSEPILDRGVKTFYFKDESTSAKICFWIILIILVFFSGLRSRMNDTATYVGTFSRRIPDTLDGLKTIDWSLGLNPLFVAYQIILRTFVTQSGHAFVFCSSLFVVSSVLIFMRRYSQSFGTSIFFYLAFCVFAFSMAAIKQTMAMAIGIWSLPLFVKKKRIRAILLVVVAMMIHPYVVIFLSAPFLYKGVWDRRTIMLLIATGIGVVLYGTIITRVLSIAASLGDDYDLEMFTSGNAINIFRFLFYLIVPVMSFMARKQIQQENNPILNACINFSVLAASFMVFARIGGDANMFGRMASYLDVFQCIAFGTLMHTEIISKQFSFIFRPALGIAFIYYYYTFFDKYVTGWNLAWEDCIYKHITILELFEGW